jgi:hypothetical protein
MTCLYTSKGETCGSLFNCCNCGGEECGCAYCYACRRCEACAAEDDPRDDSRTVDDGGVRR